MKKVLYIFCSVVIVGGGWFFWWRTDHASPGGQQTFNPKQYSLTDPESPWVIVNKARQLSPRAYTPADLTVPAVPLRATITDTEKEVRGAMVPALEKMISAAAAQGVHLNLQSGYRSYDFQTTLYSSYVQQQGKAVADSQSARPGYSEHQTGWAVDLGGTSQPDCNVRTCFEATAEGKWLAAHAHTYGFIIRYPADKTTVTGYEYEPWHLRYVGTSLSEEMHRQHIETLEEFFGLPAAPAYK